MPQSSSISSVLPYLAGYDTSRKTYRGERGGPYPLLLPSSIGVVMKRETLLEGGIDPQLRQREVPS